MEVATLDIEGMIPGEAPGPAAKSLSAAGQGASFDAFYRSERAAMVALALVLTGDRVAAEDLTQEAFLRLHEKWSRVSQYESLGAWLRHVLVNLATSRRRRLAVETKALFRMDRERRGITVSPAWDDAFWAEVRALPRRQAQAVALYYLEDQPVSAVAAILGCAEGTVRALLHQGRQTLRTRLQIEEDSDE